MWSLANFSNHSTVVTDCGLHVVVILMILCLVFFGWIVVVMWLLSFDHFLWLLFSCFLLNKNFSMKLFFINLINIKINTNKLQFHSMLLMSELKKSFIKIYLFVMFFES